MDLNSLTNGQKVVGGAGIVAIISLFLPWYGSGPFSANAFGLHASVGAWMGMFVIIAGAAIVFLKVLGKADLNRGALAAEQLGLVVAALGTVVVLLKLITDNEATKLGIYIGLLSGIAVTAGAFMVVKESGLAMPTTDDLKTVVDTDGDGEIG